MVNAVTHMSTYFLNVRSLLRYGKPCMNRKTAKNWKNIVEDFTKIPACKKIWSIICKLACGADVYFVWQEIKAKIFRKIKRDKAEIIQIM